MKGEPEFQQGLDSSLPKTQNKLKNMGSYIWEGFLASFMGGGFLLAVGVIFEICTELFSLPEHVSSHVLSITLDVKMSWQHNLNLSWLVLNRFHLANQNAQ